MIRYRLEYQYEGSDKWNEFLWKFDDLEEASLHAKYSWAASDDSYRIIQIETTETVVDQSK